MQKFKIVFIQILLIVIVPNTYGQWFAKSVTSVGQAKAYNVVKPTGDGGYISVGYVNLGGSPKEEVLVAKYNSNGDIVWSKTYGTNGADERGQGVAITSSGNYLIAVKQLDYIYSNYHLLFLEISSSGALVSTNETTLPNNAYNYDEFNVTDLKKSSTGYILAGTFGYIVSTTEYNGFFAMKLSETKTVDWCKNYIDASTTYSGGVPNKTYVGDRIMEASDGNFYFAGTIVTTDMSTYSQTYNQVILKISSTGSISWSKSLNADGYGVSTIVTSNGIYVLNNSSQSTAQNRINISKFDTNGILGWSKEYYNANIKFNVQCGITSITNGIAMVGNLTSYSGESSFGAGFFMKVDANGVFERASIQDADAAVDISQLNSADGYAIVSNKHRGFTNEDLAYLVKTNSNGDLLTTCESVTISSNTISLIASTLTFNVSNTPYTLITGTFNANAISLSPASVQLCPRDPCADYNIDFTGLPTTICPYSLPITLSGTPSGGTFSGTGVSGNTLNPAILTSGVYSISYSISNIPASCPQSVTKKTLLINASKYINRVISSTATTYSDTWPMDYTNVTSVVQSTRDALDGDGTNEVANGTKGIWHGEESYVYVDKRNQNTPLVAIKTDGIYNNMPLFDHTSAMNGGCIPKWRLVNTITEYNPSSYDLENKDILNRYSAALYGYKGDLAIAVASNAREREIAFESFEEYDLVNPLTPGTLSSGNLAVYTTTPAVSAFSKIYRPYEVLQATDNVLTVDFPSARAAAWNGRTVRVTGGNMNTYDNKDVYGKYTITAVAAHPTDATLSLVTLSSTAFTHTGIWKGKISVPADYTVSTPISNGASNLSIVSSTKHTGKNSLKTTGDASFEQIKLELIPGEKYVLSAWVSTDVPSYTYRVTSGVGRRGFTAEYLDKNGVSLGTQLIDIDDKNPVIEGWQKVEGTFQFPAAPTTAERVVIYFNSPAGTNTYWDDVRLFPFTGNMQTYVYNPLNYKVSAVLDNNNYASLYYYDAQGNLFLVKKETEKGIQTIQESFSHQKQ